MSLKNLVIQIVDHYNRKKAENKAAESDQPSTKPTTSKIGGCVKDWQKETEVWISLIMPYGQ